MLIWLAVLWTYQRLQVSHWSMLSLNSAPLLVTDSISVIYLATTVTWALPLSIYDLHGSFDGFMSVITSIKSYEAQIDVNCLNVVVVCISFIMIPKTFSVAMHIIYNDLKTFSVAWTRFYEWPIQYRVSTIPLCITITLSAAYTSSRSRSKTGGKLMKQQLWWLWMWNGCRGSM